METLIVYAKAGAGHKRAAEAALGALKRQGSGDVILVDCLDYTNSWFRRFYPQCYLLVVRFFPLLWAVIYYVLDNRKLYFLVKPLRRWANGLVSRRFAAFLKKEKPKVIISTHFFASEISAALKKKGGINSVIISVVTDFGLHSFWESEDVDLFIAASEDTRKDMLARGIPEEKIKVLGIPIDPPLRGFEQKQLRREMELSEGAFTILVVGGGFGIGPIKKIVITLDKLATELKNKMQVVVVCSHNQGLYRQMQALSAKLQIKTKIFSFVPNLYNVMAVSDLIISKSGGLTTSESLAQGLPMVIISPIPGQETKNCNLLVKKGAAIRIDRLEELKKVVQELLAEPQKLAAMRKQTAGLAHPDSAADIAVLTQELLKTENGVSH